MAYLYTSQKQIRAAFWAAHPDLEYQVREAGIKTRPQTEHSATVRCAYCDFIDWLARDGHISEQLAQRATL